MGVSRGGGGVLEWERWGCDIAAPSLKCAILAHNPRRALIVKSTLLPQNPLLAPDPLPTPEAGSYGAVVLSGLVARSAREEESILEACAAALKDDGVFVLHDAFLPAGRLPPEVVLGALGRHLTCRPRGNWSVGQLREALESLGLRDVRAEHLPAGTVVVTARKSRNGPAHQ